MPSRPTLGPTPFGGTGAFMPTPARGAPGSQAASASGYASDSAFTAMFKAAMGHPPSAFQA